MDAVRLQASDMRQMERYIDAQYGGPGRGFYRIVTDPFQARKVINGGRMAVVMGIETSVIFGCTMKLDNPACDEDEIDDVSEPTPEDLLSEDAEEEVLEDIDLPAAAPELPKTFTAEPDE